MIDINIELDLIVDFIAINIYEFIVCHMFLDFFLFFLVLQVEVLQYLLQHFSLFFHA